MALDDGWIDDPNRPVAEGPLSIPELLVLAEFTDLALVDDLLDVHGYGGPGLLFEVWLGLRRRGVVLWQRNTTATAEGGFEIDERWVIHPTAVMLVAPYFARVS